VRKQLVEEGVEAVLSFAPLEGWRHVKVTDRHTAVDYAHTLKDLSDSHFILVQDNLNTHKPVSLYELPPKQGGSSNGSNGITLQSMAVGSIWPSPNSASFCPNASIAASQTTKPSSMKSPLGRRIETPTTPRPIGSSPHPKHVSDSSIYTRQSD
jgi:hypothetical protein